MRQGEVHGPGLAPQGRFSDTPVVQDAVALALAVGLLGFPIVLVLSDLFGKQGEFLRLALLLALEQAGLTSIELQRSWPVRKRFVLHASAPA